MTPEALHEQARRAPLLVEPLTLNHLGALSEAETAVRARMVRTALLNLYVEHRRLTEAAAVMSDVIEDNTVSPPGAKTFIAITGPKLVGKSTFIRQWLIGHYRELLGPEALRSAELPEWMPDEETDARYVPVAFASLASAALRGSLSMELLAAVGIDVAKPPPTHRLVATLRSCGTRLVVLDDTHFLRTHKQLGREALDHVKKLNNELGEHGGTIVLVGADLEATELWDDRQITGRLQPITIGRFTDATAEDRGDWQRLLRGFETTLLPLFPASPPAVLSQRSAGLLLRRTQGSIRDLHKLLVAAARHASNDGTWAITPKLLERPELDTSLSAHTRHQSAIVARQKAGMRTGASANPAAGVKTGTRRAG